MGMFSDIFKSFTDEGEDVPAYLSGKAKKTSDYRPPLEEMPDEEPVAGAPDEYRMDAITEHHYHNIATGKSKRMENGDLATVHTIIVEIDGVETLIPTVWDGEIVNEKTAVEFAKKSGLSWPTRTGENAIEELKENDRGIHLEMTDQTTPEEARSILQSEYQDQSFALGGLATTKKGITTPEGLIMANKKFQLDDKEADTNGDGELSTREKEIGMAVQRNIEQELIQDDAFSLSHGGMMMDGIMGYDEVSGNPIPVGASPENVRDDIDAKLSTDEYVLPAHVVKWHGLKHIQMLQSEAEMGLMSMQFDGLIPQAETEEDLSDEDTEIDVEGVDVEVAAVEVDDKLDDEEDTQELKPMTSRMPSVRKEKSFAFMI